MERTKCRPLWEYMMFVAKIRKHRKEHSLAQAVELAVSECIREGIQKDFLEKNRAEVWLKNSKAILWKIKRVSRYLET